jgi:hypothetical protein
VDWWKAILGSKRTQAAIVGLIMAALAKYQLGVDEATVTQVVALLAAWIIGDSMRPTIAK